MYQGKGASSSQRKWQMPESGGVVLLLNGISAVHSGLSTIPLWRMVILMSVISNLLLVTWEQHVSYKLLLLSHQFLSK